MAEPDVPLTCRLAPDREARIRELAVDEARCCAFLTLDVQRAGDELVVRIAASPETAATRDTVAAAFAGPMELRA